VPFGTGCLLVRSEEALRHGHFGGNAPIFHNIHELGGDDVRLPDFADLSPASLRRELMIYGIDVIVIVPGSVVTAIWDKGEAEQDDRKTTEPNFGTR